MALLKLRGKSLLLRHRNHLTIEMLVLLYRLSALFPKRDFVAGRKAPDVAFIYAGYHYASDIIAGAALGVFTALVVARPLQIWLMPWIADVERKYTAVFYSMFFVLSYEFMTMFDEAREVGNAIRRLVL